MKVFWWKTKDLVLYIASIFQMTKNAVWVKKTSAAKKICEIFHQKDSLQFLDRILLRQINLILT